MIRMLRYCFTLLLFLPLSVLARQEFTLVLKDHLFSPARLHVPAGQRIKIRLINNDKTPEEFESFALNREKVVLGSAEAMIFIGPLSAGEYLFFGDYHPDSAKGVLIALPADEWQRRQVQHVN